MNMLHRICWRQFPRSIETIATSSNTFLAEQLSNRSLIRVKGNDVVPFLQGLVTNDMNHLHIDGLPSMFTMFLNNAGRVLYDSIIYKTADADTFLIECDREASSDLQKHLRIYRVRRKIDIECANSQYTPWILYNPIDSAKVPKPIEAKPDKVLCTVDPRLKELGVRVIQPKSNELQDIANLFPNAVVEPSTLCGYKSHRYIYGVGEGVTDHPPGKAFPLESNCDFLNGVSFHKGCYVGQELTARVYHTGVVRKRLMPLKLSSDFDPNATTVKTEAGAVVGTVRGASQRNALALLRVDQVLKATELKIGEELCEVIKPHWWPSDLSNRQSMRKD